MRQHQNRVVCAGSLVLCVLVVLFSRDSFAQPAVKFDADIQPIFEQHCWRCHSEKRAAGGLRLDERRFAEQGGGSGRNLLEPVPHRNELLRRVKSEIDGERMPSEGPSLTAEQIATLERWIAQGADWPVNMPAPMPAWAAPAKPTWEVWLDRISYATTGRYLPAYVAAMLILIAMIFVERAKQDRPGEPAANATKSAIPEAWRKRLAPLSRAWYLVAFLCVAIYVVVQFSLEQAEDLQRAQRQVAHVQSAAPGNRPAAKEIIRPQHPPRLGGIYYRGNDERSEELYNGGFYRTATFDVRLTDAEGRALAWGDPIPDQPQLRLVVERAPHASPSLFIPTIMEVSGLSPVQPEQIAKAEEIPFFNLHADIPGERWSVLFPLEPVPPQGKLAGKVYLYKGVADDETHRRVDPSYLIGYEISASNGCIAPTSQIWMGSVYNLPQLIVPEKGQIPGEHWFDFRPIPEIEM